MSTGYKKCPNGHFYKDDLAQCPYCDRYVSFRVEEDDKEEFGTDTSRIDDSKLKLCPNQHAFENSLDECPFCGERQVDGVVNANERFLVYKMSWNVDNKEEVISITHVTKNGNVTHTTTYTFDKGLNIEVGFIGNAILYYDVRGDFKEIMPELVECEIAIGDEKMTGREFISKIDEMLKKEIGVNGRIDLSSIDENEIVKDCCRRFYPGRENPSYESLKEIQVIKVCPQGHGYNEEEQTCPFCGDAQVLSTQQGVIWENTLYYNDLWYENEGVQINILKAIVDGAEIAGDIRLRVYYTGSYKYKYCVAEFDQISNELMVTRESKVILIGDGFSKTYSGCEYFEMCDKLFEKFDNL